MMTSPLTFVFAVVVKPPKKPAEIPAGALLLLLTMFPELMVPAPLTVTNAGADAEIAVA